MSSGAVRGSILAAWRLARCNPFSHGGYDPVEERPLLQAEARGARLMLLLAANPLQPLIDVANAVLTFFHDDVGVGWGVSIILLTFVTRIVILPLSLSRPLMRSLQAHRAGDQEDPGRSTRTTGSGCSAR